jgi:hypothetical protein
MCFNGSYMTYKIVFPSGRDIFLENCAALIKEKRLEKKLRQQDISAGYFIIYNKRIEQNPNVELGSFIKVLWHLNILDGLAEVLPKSLKILINNSSFYILLLCRFITKQSIIMIHHHALDVIHAPTVGPKKANRISQTPS